MSFKTRTLAISSILASFFMILRAIPTFPMIGFSGAKFSASDFILPLYGVLLGPTQGTLVVILGTILGFMFKPPIFLFLDFLPPATNTLIVGLLFRKRKWFAILVYTTVLLAFLLGPFTLVFVRIGFFNLEVDIPFHWLHLATLPITLMLIRLDATKENTEGVTWKRFLGCALLGTMGQHSIGSFLFQIVVGLTGGISKESFAVVWHTVFWVYPIERLLLVIFSTLVGVPVAKILMDAFKKRPQSPS